MYSRAELLTRDYLRMNNNNNSKKTSRARLIPAARITQRPRASIPRAVPSKLNTFSGTDLLVNNLAGATTFTATRYRVNPGVSSVMKGLQAIASRYDKYRFRKLQLEYVPKQAISTTKGMVHLAFDMNANHGAPTLLSDLSVYEFHDYTQVYGECRLSVPEARLRPERWVRCGPAPGDLNLYDALGVIVAVDAMADTTAVGDIFLHYEVEFSGMQVEPSTPVPRSFALYNLSATQNLTTATIVTIAFDETVVDTIGGTLASGVYTPGCGAYEVQCEVSGADTASETFSLRLDLYKNGAALSAVPCGSLHRQAAVATGTINVSLFGYVTCDTDDTIEVKVTATGAAGGLTLNADLCRLLIRAL